MRIIFKNNDSSVGILIPTVEALNFATIEQVAEKDVPKDLPYWIRPVEDVPTDRAYRDAWEVDVLWGEPDGFGGENNEFDADLLEAYNANK